MNLYFRTPINQTMETVAKRFDKKLFNFLSPEFSAVKIKRFDGCMTGDEIHLELTTLGMHQDWVSVITSHREDSQEWGFIDEGKILPWPLKRWHHHHRVVKTSEFRCEIIDDIHYECPNQALEKIMYPVLWSVFAIRPGRYKKFFRN
jgi:ligand-binding SRPBCC domain-containing protein